MVQSLNIRKPRREGSSISIDSRLHPTPSLIRSSLSSRVKVVNYKMAPTTTSRPSQPTRGKHGKFVRQPPPNAAMQLQTQALPKTAVSQHMTVETSVQLVQTLTQACVSSLAKLRHMFDDSNYEPRQINVSDLADGGEGQSQSGSPKPPVLLQFSSLKRGVTSRADRLLDWVVS
jgi:hypothetical protein